MELNRNAALQAILDNLSGADNTPSLVANDSFSNSIPGLELLRPESNATRAGTIPPQLKKPEDKESAVRPVPDASTITTWPPALKYVTKHILSNEMKANRIRQLVSEQHKHERKWWSGREAIVTKHKGRAETQQKAADLLKSLGGVATTVTENNAQAAVIELVEYDKKVYSELTKMAADLDRQLRSMGVPFYVIKHELVISKEEKEKLGTVGRIDRDELRELQKRILQTLEDLLLE